MSRAAHQLGIKWSCAPTPQAKGRVERSYHTLQDRWVKEFRLRGIRTLEEANMALPELIAIHNERFAVSPVNPQDAHRPCHKTPETIQKILSKHYERTLSKNLQFSHDSVVYQIQAVGIGYALRKSKIMLHQHMDGSEEIIYKGRCLKFSKHYPQKRPPKIADRKSIDAYYARHLSPEALDGMEIVHEIEHKNTSDRWTISHAA